MKATGIVRRIDDLGRVVIPKELRRTMRIREGDPLEIFTDKDGELIFKKYSPIGELSEHAQQLCECLRRATEQSSAVCDRDSVIALSGAGRKELLEKAISPQLSQLLERRSAYSYAGGEEELPVIQGDSLYRISTLCPVISQGDLLGGVLFVCPKGEPPATELEQKLAQIIAGFLGRQMED